MFDLTPEQVALQQMAQDFADSEIAPHALQWDRERFFPVDTLRKAAALGMGALCVPEDLGGSGLSRFDGVLIYEALATGCPCVAAFISIHNLISWAVGRYGSEAQRKAYLPGLASMATIASYCLTEPGAGSDAAALTTRASRDGGDYVLDGVKQFISGAGVSDLYLVMARTGASGPKGISAFLVEKGSAGLSFGANERKMGWNAQPTAQVILEGVRVPAAARLGAEGEGFSLAMAALDGGRLNIGACSLGGASAAMAKAIAYGRERKAFGSRIVDFQVQQFRLADMATALESARALLHRAARALDAGDAQATSLAAMAKRLATDAGFQVANDALQMFGGYGYLADAGVEKIVRDLRVHQILEGTNDIMRVIVARGLLKGWRASTRAPTPPKAALQSPQTPPPSDVSSVIGRWMKHLGLGGVIVSVGLEGAAGELHRRRAAGQIDDAHVAPEYAVAQAGAQRLGAGFLGGEAFRIRRRPLRATLRLPLLHGRKTALHEAIAEPLKRVRDTRDRAEIAADADDHAICLRPSSIALRIKRTLSASPTKIASPIRKCPMLSSTISGNAAARRAVS